jgi:hypothetical protein
MVVEKCPDITVAVVQYTFTHKQYREKHNDPEYTERNIHTRVVPEVPDLTKEKKTFWKKSLYFST